MLSDRAVALAAEIEAAFPFETQRRAVGFEAMAHKVLDVWSAGDGPDQDRHTLREMSRFSAAMMVVHLEATPGGLSLARLKAVVERPGLGGMGHGRAVLTYLRYLGYVEPLPREGDGRVQLYRVTDTIRAVLRRRMHRELAARIELDPAVRRMLDRFDDDDLVSAFLVLLSETALAVLRKGTPRDNPADLFSQRQSGMVLLCELAKRGASDDVFPPRGPLDYAVADLARRSGASRMQVGHLLRKARDAGALIVGPDGRDRFSPGLADGLERAIASSTLMIVGAAKIALDDAGVRPGSVAE